MAGLRALTIVLLAAVIAGLIAPATAHAALPRDPLGSPMWERLGISLFGDAPVRFDPRVRVIFPEIAENQRQFPVTVDARGIPGVKRILLFADLNPIPLAIDYALDRAQPYLSTRIKLDQRTPVRGAVQLADGSWLVSGAWIDAAGGGCSLPPVSRVKGDWAQHLGEVRGLALWSDAGTRVRLAFRHPMDTGFVNNIPTYNLEQVALTGADGAKFGEMQIEASVAEDPDITVIVDARKGGAVTMAGRDTNGIEYTARLTPATAIAARE
jgi:sulfur-oxidizing protein SoxY